MVKANLVALYSRVQGAVTVVQMLAIFQSSPNRRVRSKAWYLRSRSSYEIQKEPSSPNLWSSFCSHSAVQLGLPSDQGPFHSCLPHGFLSRTSRVPSISTARITE